MATPHRRTYETGMDFEWENQRGPQDANSPWKNAANFSKYANGLQKKGGFGDLRMDNSAASPFPATYPTASIFSQPSSPTKPLPAIPNHMSSVNAFTTPRKSRTEVYDSSEAESTPGYAAGTAADNEATPDNSSNAADMGLKNKFMSFISGSKELQNSHIGSIRAPSEFSNWSYERREEDRVSKPKRRRRDHPTSRSITRKHRRSSDDTDDYSSANDSAAAPRSRRRNANGSTGRSKRSKGNPSDDPRPGFLLTILDYIHARPYLPWILSVYVQLFLNMFGAFIAGYASWLIFSSIRSDIGKRNEQARRVVRAENEACIRNFNENGCGAATVVPALITMCNDWKQCFERDPAQTAGSGIGAGMIAEIVDEFVAHISWRTVAVVVIIAACYFGAINSLFPQYRKNHLPPPPAGWFNNQGNAHEQVGYDQQTMPQTPQAARVQGGQHVDHVQSAYGRSDGFNWTGQASQPLRSPVSIVGAQDGYASAVGADSRMSPRKRLMY